MSRNQSNSPIPQKDSYSGGSFTPLRKKRDADVGFREVGHNGLMFRAARNPGDPIGYNYDYFVIQALCNENPIGDPIEDQPVGDLGSTGCPGS